MQLNAEAFERLPGQGRQLQGVAAVEKVVGHHRNGQRFCPIPALILVGNVIERRLVGPRLVAQFKLHLGIVISRQPEVVGRLQPIGAAARLEIEQAALRLQTGRGLRRDPSLRVAVGRPGIKRVIKSHLTLHLKSGQGENSRHGECKQIIFHRINPSFGFGCRFLP